MGCIPLPIHASAGTCANGVCTITACETNWGDCNGLWTDGTPSSPLAPHRTGCETDFLNDKTKCGDCGTNCVTLVVGNVTEAQCAQGSCDILSCDSGRDSCNNDPFDGSLPFPSPQPVFFSCCPGCETRLDLPATCGACNISCNVLPPGVAATVCFNFTCKITQCAANRSDCNGIYTDGPSSTYSPSSRSQPLKAAR